VTGHTAALLTSSSRLGLEREREGGGGFACSHLSAECPRLLGEETTLLFIQGFCSNTEFKHFTRKFLSQILRFNVGTSVTQGHVNCSCLETFVVNGFVTGCGDVASSNEVIYRRYCC
jgi:hypothetical protein